MTLRVLRIACVVLVLTGLPAAAQVTCPGGARTWIGAAGGAWNVNGNWNPAGPPGNGGDACFATGNPSVALPTGNTNVRGIYILSGVNLTISGVAGTGNFRINAGGINADGTVAIGGTGGTVRLSSTQTWVINSSGNTIALPIAFAGLVTKSGPGNVIFTGTGSTHSGGFTINAGELRFNGSYSANEGTVTVNSGATLSGSGELQAAVTVNAGGIYSPGSGGSGTLTTLGLILNNTASVNVTVGTSTTRGAVTGALTLNGILNITAGSGFGQGTYTIFTATGAITNSSLTLGAVPAGLLLRLPGERRQRAPQGWSSGHSRRAGEARRGGRSQWRRGLLGSRHRDQKPGLPRPPGGERAAA